MPIVAQLVGAELGRPVAVDAHPKHAVALGAAWLASGALSTTAPPRAVAGPTVGTASVPPAGLPVIGSAPLGGAALGGAALGGAAAAAAAPVSVPPVVSGPPVSPPPVSSPPVSPPPVSSPPVSSPPVSSVPPVGSGAPGGRARTGPPPVAPTSASRPYIGPVYGAGGKQVRSGSAPGGDRAGSRRSMPLIAAGIALFLVIAGGGIALALTNNNKAAGPGGDGKTTGAVATTEPAGPAVPPDEQCTDAIKSNPRWVCLTSATVEGNVLTIEYDAEWAGDTPTIQGGFHLHIYGSDGTDPAEDIMGQQAGNSRGAWHIDDRDPVVLATDSPDYQQVFGNYPKVCARIARAGHNLVRDSDGGFHTGNCVPIK
jgi:hypothetical protein